MGAESQIKRRVNEEIDSWRLRRLVDGKWKQLFGAVLKWNAYGGTWRVLRNGFLSLEFLQMRMTGF